jgi:hypothetical protein
VLQSYWWLVLLIAAVLAVALLFWDRVGRVLVSAAPVWVPLAFVIFYLLGAGAAGGDYRDHKDSGFQRYPWVRVWTEPDTGVAKLDLIRQDLAEGKYRLRLQTDQSLYLTKPKGGGGDADASGAKGSGSCPAADTDESRKSMIGIAASRFSARSEKQ